MTPHSAGRFLEATAYEQALAAIAMAHPEAVLISDVRDAVCDAVVKMAAEGTRDVDDLVQFGKRRGIAAYVGITDELKAAPPPAHSASAEACP